MFQVFIVRDFLLGCSRNHYHWMLTRTRRTFHHDRVGGVELDYNHSHYHKK